MTEYLQYKIELEERENASLFDELSFWSSHFGSLLFKHIEIRRGLHILDLACGNGFPLFELAQVFGPSCRIIGADIWQSALVRAQWKKQLYQLHNVELVISNGEQLAFHDNKFDLIVSNLGINNFAQPAAVLGECRRVLKPGSKVILTTNLVGHMKELYQLFRDLLATFDRKDYFERLAINENHRGTPESITLLLADAGFRVTRSVLEDLTLRYLDGTTLLNSFLTKVGFIAGWRRVVDPADEARLFQLLETELNRRAETAVLSLTIPMLFIEAEKV